MRQSSEYASLSFLMTRISMSSGLTSRSFRKWHIWSSSDDIKNLWMKLIMNNIWSDATYMTVVNFINLSSIHAGITINIDSQNVTMNFYTEEGKLTNSIHKLYTLFTISIAFISIYRLKFVRLNLSISSRMTVLLFRNSTNFANNLI